MEKSYINLILYRHVLENWVTEIYNVQLVEKQRMPTILEE